MRTLPLAAWLLACAALGALAAPNQLSEVVVTVEEDAQPLVDVLRRLERRHGLNYVISQEALQTAGTVTVHLKDVPLDVALESICSACGLTLEIRGPVLVIVPKGAAGAAVVPRLDTGVPPPALVEREQARQRGVKSDAEEPDLSQADGKLLLVDRADRRLVLQVDGVKRDFYLPSQDDPQLPGMQVAALEQALGTLRPGTRIVILYRRDPTRPVVTSLVGGAYTGTQEARERERRARERRARQAEAKGEAAAVGTPATGPAPVLETAEPAAHAAAEAPPPAGEVKVAPANPAAGRDAAPEMGARNGAPTVEEGIVGGKFVSLEGEVITLERASDGKPVTCLLPRDDPAKGDRRQRVQETLTGLAKGATLYLTYEELEGQRYVTNTITESR